MELHFFSKQHETQWVWDESMVDANWKSDWWSRYRYRQNTRENGDITNAANV